MLIFDPARGASFREGNKATCDRTTKISPPDLNVVLIFLSFPHNLRRKKANKLRVTFFSFYMRQSCFGDGNREIWEEEEGTLTYFTGGQ